MTVTEHDFPPFPSGMHPEHRFEERGLAAGRGIMFGLAIMLPFYAAAAVAVLLILH